VEGGSNRLMGKKPQGSADSALRYRKRCARENRAPPEGFRIGC